MYLQTISILAGMVVLFFISLKFFKFPPEMSLLVISIGALIIGYLFFDIKEDFLRHVAEGAGTYLDIILAVIAATFFMNILKETGMLNVLIQGMINLFSRSRILILLSVMFLILLPGALTGAGSASVLISGEIAAIILSGMGIPLVNIAAIIFICSALSVTAPPINIYAMIMCGGVNMPYVGFFGPLAIVSLSLAIISVLFLGRKANPLDVQGVLSKIEVKTQTMKTGVVLLPPLLLLALMISMRIWPFRLPILGLPLEFLISAFAAMLIAWLYKVQFRPFKIMERTFLQLFPLISTLVAIGVLVQVMSLTGVRGLFVITILTLPIVLVYLILILGLPFGETVLLFGVAAVLGVPLVLLFNSMAKNPIIVAAAISLICPVGDILPPTKLLGRLIVSEISFKGKYIEILKKCAIPGIVIIVTGIVMIVFA